MKSEDAKRFTELLVQLSEVFDDGKNVPESKTIIYFNILANYSIGKIETAVNALLKTRVYPGLPKPAEIIQALCGTEEDRYQRQLEENKAFLIERRKMLAEESVSKNQ